MSEKQTPTLADRIETIADQYGAHQAVLKDQDQLGAIAPLRMELYEIAKELRAETP